MAKKKKYQFGDPNYKPTVKTDERPVMWDFLKSDEGHNLISNYLKSGYTLDSTEGNQLDFSRPTGYYDYNKPFQIFNALAQLTTGVANRVNDVKSGKKEYEEYIKSLQSPSYENFDEQGLNDTPIYTKYGGKSCMNGCGEVDHAMIHEMMKSGGWIQGAIKHPGRCAHPGDEKCPKGSPQYNLAMRFKHGDLHHKKMPYGGGPLTAEGAKEILRDGKVHGKKLTPAQRRYFGYIAGGGKPKSQYGMDENDMYDTPQIEAEEGEVYETPQGQLKKISDNAPMHENGGVVIGDAERVLENTSDLRKDKKSQALKLSPELVSLLTGFETSKPMSHSAAMEHASKNIKKETSKVESKLKKNVDSLEESDANKYANASLNFNLLNLGNQPKENSVFDLLFHHQEMVKAAHGIENPKAQYGIDNAERLKDITGWEFLYSKGPRNFYRKGDGSIVSTTGPKASNEDWKRIFASLSPQRKQEIRNQAQGYKYGYTQENPTIDLNFETGLPDMPTPTIPVPTILGNQPAQPEDPTGRQFNVFPQYPKSQFNEPLHWYDVAGPVSALTEGRIPVRYNSANLNQLRLRQQNPLPSLQAGQRDYNAALQFIPQNSQGYGNAASIFSKKYGIDSQILGQYENINNQIKNQEIQYNTGVRDRQSLIDQQARGTFENQRLGSLEAQRQSKNEAWNAIYSTIAQNRKLNREGNLLMQLFPAFNQTGQYNGYNVPFHVPLGMNPGLPANTSVVPNQLNNGQYQYFIKLPDGSMRPISFKKNG